MDEGNGQRKVLLGSGHRDQERGCRAMGGRARAIRRAGDNESKLEWNGLGGDWADRRELERASEREVVDKHLDSSTSDNGRQQRGETSPV